MNNSISIYDLIRESQCTKPWIFDDWLKKNKPTLEILYSTISAAFEELSEKESTSLPSLITKQVSTLLPKPEPSTSSEDHSVSMNNGISIYDLIRESQCTKPWIFDDWLKKNKPSLEIPYSTISAAFEELSQKEFTKIPPLITKQISTSTSEPNKSSETDSLSEITPPTTEITPSTTEITPSIARAVLQREAGITVSTATQPIIGSFGASSCVIISLYNKKTKTCALAHIDILSHPPTVLDMLSYQLAKGSPDRLTVELATGQTAHNQLLQELKRIISENKNMSLEKIHCSLSLAIDARTGKTFVDVHHDSMDLGLNHEKRIEKGANLARFSFGKTLLVSLIFDGRNS